MSSSFPKKAHVPVDLLLLTVQLLTWNDTHIHKQKNTNGDFFPRSYLKKSFLQYSLPSREKHFSVKLHLHSQHCTHLTCQALSSTLSRKRSRIGLSQPAQWTMAFGFGLYTTHTNEAHTLKLKSTTQGRALTEYILLSPGQCARRSQSIRCQHSFLPACVKRLQRKKQKTRPLSQVRKAKKKGEKNNQSFIESEGKKHAISTKKNVDFNTGSCRSDHRSQFGCCPGALGCDASVRGAWCVPVSQSVLERRGV